MNIVEFSNSLVLNENGIRVCNNNDYIELIREIHGDSPPCNTLYSDITVLVYKMTDYPNLCEDDLHRLADSMVDAYHHDLFVWASKNYSLVNEVDTDGSEYSASQIIQMAQYSHYYEVASTIFYAMDDTTEEGCL